MLLLNEMVLVGEWLRAVNSKNIHMRLLLAKFYGLLGASTMVQELVQSLDIKYVQRDTLGYLLFDHLNNFGRFTNAVVYYVDLCGVFDQGEREVRFREFSPENGSVNPFRAISSRSTETVERPK